MNFIILTCLPTVFFQRALGAYQTAHHLRKHGYTCQVIDYTYSFTSEELINTVKKFITKDTLGIGVSSTFFNENDDSQKSTKPIRSFSPGLHTNIKDVLLHIGINYPKIKRIIGGGYSSLFYNDPLIDIVVDGYSEDAMLDIARNLKTNNFVPKVIEQTNKNFDIETLDHRFTTQDCILPGEVLPIEISRGCIFRCSFCSYPLNGKKKLDYIRDPKCVAEEMLYNYKNFGTTNYIFTDDTFNDSTEKLRALNEEIKKLPFKINFYAYLRLDLLYAHQEQIPLLKELGLRSCGFGVETLHPIAAKTIGKNMPAEKTKSFLMELHNKHWRNDVNIGCSLIIGLPGEPMESIKGTMDWFYSSPFSAVFFSLTFQSDYKWKSEFVLNPEKYGYKFDENGQWYTDIMTEKQAINLHLRGLVSLVKTDQKVDAFTVMAAMNHYNKDIAVNLTVKQLDYLKDEISNTKKALCNQYKNQLLRLVV